MTKRINSIKELRQLLEKKIISVDEVCEQCVQRMRKFRSLNAFVCDTSSAAKESASHTKNDGPLRPMEGVAVAIKDNFCTKDIPTTCGSRMLESYKPPYTATVVTKLENAGAFVLGKTNLDEFAMGCGSVDSSHGPVRNPWKYDFSNKDPNYEDWYIAGGSSGGSAVAVATDTVFAAIGSDTGGSVRNPASYNGVVGLKPTYGRVSRHGLIPLVNSMDVPGIFTRTVDDAVCVLNQLSGSDDMDSTTVRRKYDQFTLPDEIDIKGFTIGVPQEYHTPGMDKDVVDAWSRMADMFENAGARVKAVSLPHTQYSINCYTILCVCEVASNMARYDGVEFGHRAGDETSTEAMYALSRHEGFNDVVRSRILAGNYLLLKKNYHKHFMQAMRVRRLIAQDFENVFQDGVDLLLSPTVISDAPMYSDFKTRDNRARTQEQDVCTQPVNLAGVAAVTVPTGLSTNGLPIGLQLISPHFHEQRMLYAAKWMEQQTEFSLPDFESLIDDPV